MHSTPEQPKSNSEGSSLAPRVPRVPASTEIMAPLDPMLESVESGVNAHSRGRAPTIAGVLRYKKTILLTSIIVLILSQLVIWTLIPPHFRATAIIEIQPIIPTLLDKSDNSGPLPFYQQYLETQADFATSNAVLNRVLDRAEVLATAWYRNEPRTFLSKFASAAPPLDRLRDELEVTVPRNKQVLQISMATPFPGDAKIIAEAVADEYTRYVTETRFTQDGESLQSLTKLKESTAGEIDLLDAQIVALQNNPELQSPDLEQLLSNRKQALEDLLKNKSAINLEIRIIEQRLHDLMTSPKSGQGPSASHQADFASDVRWQELTDKLDQLQDELAAAQATFGSEHREVRRLNGLVARLVQQRSAREAFLEDHPPEMQGDAAGAAALASGDPSSMGRRREELLTRLDALEKDITEQSQSFDVTWMKYQKYLQARKELTAKRDLMARIEQRIFEFEQVRKAPAHIRRVGDAYEPQEPDDDKRPKMALAGVFGALAVGMGIGLLRFRMNPKVCDVKDIAPHLQSSPLLGRLLIVDGKRTNSVEFELNTFQHEAVRGIRTVLMPYLTSDSGKAFQITSAGPGAGKTTFCVMLAESLASCGKRVLLVDADFRRGALSRRLNCKNHPGLIDLLKANEMARETVVIHRSAGLDVIPVGTEKSLQSSELLANGVLGRRLREWRWAYDVIMVDSCPIMPVADGAMLAQQVDGSILVVREGHCDRKIVGEALSQISAVGGHAIGVVFVGAPDSTREHYYGGYEATSAR